MRSLAKLQNRLADLEARHARICKATDDIVARLDEQLAIQARIERALLERCWTLGLSERPAVLPDDSPAAAFTTPLTRKALQSLNVICGSSTARLAARFQAHPAASARSKTLTPPNTSDMESSDTVSFDGTWSSVCSPLFLFGEASISEATWGSSVSVIDLTDSTAPGPLPATLSPACTDEVGSTEVALPPDASVARKGTRAMQLIADSKDIQYHTILHSAFQQTKSNTVARLRRKLAHLGMSGA